MDREGFLKERGRSASQQSKTTYNGSLTRFDVALKDRRPRIERKRSQSAMTSGTKKHAKRDVSVRDNKCGTQKERKRRGGVGRPSTAFPQYLMLVYIHPE